MIEEYFPAEILTLFLSQTIEYSVPTSKRISFKNWLIWSNEESISFPIKFIIWLEYSDNTCLDKRFFALLLNNSMSVKAFDWTKLESVKPNRSFKSETISITNLSIISLSTFKVSCPFVKFNFVTLIDLYKSNPGIIFWANLLLIEILIL